MFADDTTVFDNQMKKVIHRLNRVIQNLRDWCVHNKIIVDTEKSEVMIIAPKPFIGPLNPLHFGEDLFNLINS